MNKGRLDFSSFAEEISTQSERSGAGEKLMEMLCINTDYCHITCFA
jgi:hypothetical protein